MGGRAPRQGRASPTRGVRGARTHTPRHCGTEGDARVRARAAFCWGRRSPTHRRRPPLARRTRRQRSASRNRRTRWRPSPRRLTRWRARRWESSTSWRCAPRSHLPVGPPVSTAAPPVRPLGSPPLRSQEDDEYADTRILDAYREQRVAQLKALAKQAKFGTVMPLSRQDFVTEVTKASEECAVVLLLFKDSVPDSQLLYGLLRRVSSTGVALRRGARASATLIPDLGRPTRRRWPRSIVPRNSSRSCLTRASSATLTATCPPCLCTAVGR